MLKVIFFDAAGTLIHLTRSVGENYRDVIARFGVEVDASALDRAFRQAWAAAPRRIASDGPRADDDKGWWHDLVARVFTQALAPAQAAAIDFPRCFDSLYEHFAGPGIWAAYPEAAETLQSLRARGFALGIISNFDRRLHAILGHVRLAAYFDQVILSSEVGAEKPDPAIFRYALEALGVTAAEALHVGDDPKRDWGADALGLRVFRLKRPEVSLSDLLTEIAAPDREGLRNPDS